MATIWLTYRWDDNKDQDVDFLAHELVAAGLTVKLDRWNLGAGRRLWEQIENFIQNPRGVRRAAHQRLATHWSKAPRKFVIEP